MEGKKSTKSESNPTKRERCTKLNKHPESGQHPENLEVSKSISIHSKLLGKSYNLNRSLLKEKDSLILLQQNYIEKCNEYSEKEVHLNGLKKRMAQLLEAQDAESNFITWNDEVSTKEVNSSKPQPVGAQDVESNFITLNDEVSTEIVHSSKAQAVKGTISSTIFIFRL